MMPRQLLRTAIAGLFLALVCLPSVRAAQSPAEWVDRYFAQLSTWSAEFHQTVNGDQGSAARNAAGRLYLRKPGRFRWDYTSPSEQMVLADGRKLWFYDKDLAQVNVRDMDATLASTPAVLLSSGAPVSHEFEISALADSDGLSWYELRPRQKNSDFLAVRLGFAKGELRRMVLADKLNQATRLDFSNATRNQPLADGLFSFTPPAGVDVIGSAVDKP